MKRVAVVTGGGRGIGRAVAEALGEDGWSVAVAGRTPDTIDEVARKLGPSGLAVQTDVTKPNDVENLFNQTVDTFGHVDLLFNNAGMAASPVPVDELPIDEWNNVVAVNLTGAFLCARAAFGHMRRQNPTGGRIINNGSISATTPRLYSAAYTSTKHAITGLTKSLSLDGRQYAISCGQLDLGNISSDMGSGTASGALQADGSRAAEPTIGYQAVCDAVRYMANLPADTNTLTMTVMANGMPFVGRG